MKKNFYITTAIDYPNGKPHLGHAYEKVLTDAYARWYRLQERQVHFLTGLDENGQKLIESAKLQGKETKAFVDEQAVFFKEMCTSLKISHNDFIRTTELRHFEIASKLWERLKDKGDVYFGKYSGQYCLQCENFYTPTQAPDNICPDHKIPLQTKEEAGYFFKLSEFSTFIIDHIKNHPDFVVPSSARKEILSRLESEPLRDLAISRPSEGWGVPVPQDEKFVMYTWFDALINYYSALNTKETESFWPAALHVIGKDIVWFHAVIWPCMLKALGIALPEQIYVHGMILAEDGKKMSKSLGNGVDPMDLVSRYPLDTFRYYLLRYISSSGDGRFSENEMLERHNGELANDFGNLLSRVVKLSLANAPAEVSGDGVKQELNFDDIHTKMKAYMDSREHDKALGALWEAMGRANLYVNDSAPWKFKKDPVRFKEIIYNCLYTLHVLSVLISPFLPDSSSSVFKTLGVVNLNKQGLGAFSFGETSYKLEMPDSLFPKIEKKL